MIGIVCALRRRVSAADSERGNIAMLMMAIIVSVAVGTLILAMIINQDRTTTYDSSRVRSLNAAQAGIDVMLGQIRQATSTTNGTSYGDSNLLPCSPLTGSANGTGNGTYSVTVAYYLTDPAAGGSVMRCVPGYGPYDSGGTHTPRFAKISSTGVQTGGVGSSAGRTVTTTYALQTDDANVSGGQLQLYSSSAAHYCLDAGAAQPSAGAGVVVQPCSTTVPVVAQQVFAYRTDLSIQLVSSITSAYTTGLCVDTASTPHAAGVQVVLQPCKALGSATWNQQWGFDGYGHLAGSQAGSPSPDRDTYCLSAATQSAGQQITLAGCDNNVTSTSQTLVPSATAGAGAAGGLTKQIVNFQNFATCIDVTNNNPNFGFVILYSCKGNPDPTKIDSNQLFTPALGPPSATAAPLVTKIGTTIGNTAYCLQSPTATGGYAIFTTNCTTTWTWNQTLDVSGNTLPYAQVYTITDGANRCLAPGPSSDLYNGAYRKLIVTTCTGGTDQKWNADPTVIGSHLYNTTEK